MALSYFSNWERRFLHLHSSDMKMIPKTTTTELSHEEEDLLTLPDLSVIDQFLLDTDELFLTGNDLNSLLSDFSPPPPSLPPPTPPPSQLFSTQTQQPFCLQREYYHDPIFDVPNPKRHKPTCDYYNNCDEQITDYSLSNPNFFDDPFLVNNSFLEPTFQLTYSLPLENNNNNNNMNFPPTQTSMMPSFANGPPVYCNGSSSNSRCDQMNMNVKETNVSAQSIAARQRRRKITEKTQELGKLVPGGQKMNTAEMLQSAYKYIQFLQAQVGVLESMGSFDRDQQENEGLFPSEELQCLLDSKLIQEKLYSTEKCLVPQTYVEELSKNHELVRINPELLARAKEECRSLDSNSYF